MKRTPVEFNKGRGFNMEGSRMKDLSLGEMTDLYKRMLLIRYTEEKLKEKFTQGVIPGFIHLAIGQEGVAAGVCANLRTEDYIASTHRGHGHALAKRMDLNKFMAEIYGKINGFCKGRGGSMHLADWENGILGSNGIVGGGIPIATGVAYACKYKGTDQVVVSFFGEGATGTGAFHEALNLASVWSLPILYCCETNGWAEFSGRSVHMKIQSVVERAQAYDMERHIVDGDDVLAVYNIAEELIEKIRKGSGPIFLECKTHRWEGHYVGDPQSYRSPEELTRCKEYCPIERLEKKLLSSGDLSEGTLDNYKKEVKESLNQAVKYAEESPLPTPEDLTKDVYCDTCFS